MSPNIINDIVEQVVMHYLTSDNFNGLLWSAIKQKVPNDGPDRRQVLKKLLSTGRITFRTSSLDPNPGIKRSPDLTTVEYLQLADQDSLEHLTLYPTIKEMSKRPCSIDIQQHPFMAMLAKGYSQMDYCCFDLTVLEHYRNDPRYYCKASDVEGHIYISHNRSCQSLRQADRVFLQTFSFAYDADLNRTVAVYIRYLCDLTVEHQRIWHAKLIPHGRFILHPDYYQMSLLGQYPTHCPILDAFTLELYHINQMCKLMGKPPLFHKTFRDQEKPNKFTFLIRPTSYEFNEFILLLDKMMSDNINKEFFCDEIPMQEDVPRKDGKIEVRVIGTIRLLEEWISKSVRLGDPKPMKEAINAFKEIRKLRQNPAHVVEPDRFDQAYLHQQRNIIKRAYTAVRFLRLLFANHPAVTGYQVDVNLAEGRIRDF